ncbi:MAG: 16S rRNA (guanine(966)-N(2))-methyltransferase RsmD [Steroidobacteraceae bacterium]|nr:16S rRNA (guanine(966)-N(2))-methyltransferase RsmD [Steroidobacteraceae bacterium]
MKAGKPKNAGSTAAQAGPDRTLRIIGGAWRGRKIRFPPVEAVRPTPDRVRETVFNWLQQDMAGARCLDLYAGSGALGLEALSRGAAQVVFVEVDQAVGWHLSQMLAQLGCDRGQVVRADATRYLEGVPQPFDIAFLDPPFAERALEDTCRRLDECGWLRMGGLAYLEAPAATGVPVLPVGWTLLRSKRAGEVGYHLARRGPSTGE